MTDHKKKNLMHSKVAGAVLFAAALGMVLLAAKYENRVKTPAAQRAGEQSQQQTAIVAANRVPIPQGRQEFSVSTNAKHGPRIQNGVVDPMDPVPGAMQTLSIRVSDSEPVTSVMAVVTFDTTSRKFPLRLASGTPMDGVWQARWPVNDTYHNTYALGLSAQSKRGTSKIDIVLR